MKDQSMKKLNNLNSEDIYSLLLFTLFRLTNVPEYSTLSELIYLLDKENFLKLCKYFGGLTIKIPTLEDLQYLLYTLLIYEEIINGKELDDALTELKLSSKKLKFVKRAYNKLLSVMQEYDFVKR